MFGSLGGPELLLILVLALLLFGPRRLPEIGRTIGRGLSEFRKATSEFKSSLEREVDVAEVRRTREALTRAGRDVSDSISGNATAGPVPRAEASQAGPATPEQGEAPAPGGAVSPASDAPDQPQR